MKFSDDENAKKGNNLKNQKSLLYKNYTNPTSAPPQTSVQMAGGRLLAFNTDSQILKIWQTMTYNQNKKKHYKNLKKNIIKSPGWYVIIKLNLQPYLYASIMWTKFWRDFFTNKTHSSHASDSNARQNFCKHIYWPSYTNSHQTWWRPRKLGCV